VARIGEVNEYEWGDTALILECAHVCYRETGILRGSSHGFSFPIPRWKRALIEWNEFGMMFEFGFVGEFGFLDEFGFVDEYLIMESYSS